MLSAWSGARSASVSQAVEGDDPVSLGQEGHLMAPEVAVHDRPGRQQEHGLPAGAELLPVDPLARAADVAGAGGVDSDEHGNGPLLPDGL